MNTAAPLARRPGRPSRLSREQIVTTTLAMVEGTGVAGFTVAKLAKRLGAAPMALYRYFPSRDALLDAVAERAFNQIALPDRSGEWQTFVREWLQVLTAHFQRHPIALEVIAWDEHLSPGWLRVWLPLMQVLAEQEPDDERLAYMLRWFSHASLGFIQGYITGPSQVRGFGEDALDPFQPAERELLRRVHRHHAETPSSEILDFGFRHIVGGLQMLLDTAGSTG